MKKALIYFYKYPERGKVKTRLAASVGNENAFGIYNALLKDMFDSTVPVTADKIIACAVEDPRLFIHPGYGCDYFIQKGEDLGERMHHAFTKIFSGSYDSAVLMGSDCPRITSSLIEEAFDALEVNDYVLGPGSDGGYYLIGMKPEGLTPKIFQDIPWSTGDVLELTINKIIQLNSSHTLLKELNDIDDIEDLKNFYQMHRGDRNSHTINYLSDKGEVFHE